MTGISSLWSLCCEIKFLKTDTSFNRREVSTFTSDPTIQNSTNNATFRKDLLKRKKTCYLSLLMQERRSCVSTLRLGILKSSCTCILSYSELYDEFSTKQIEKKTYKFSWLNIIFSQRNQTKMGKFSTMKKLKDPGINHQE